MHVIQWPRLVDGQHLRAREQYLYRERRNDLLVHVAENADLICCCRCHDQQDTGAVVHKLERQQRYKWKQCIALGVRAAGARTHCAAFCDDCIGVGWCEFPGVAECLFLGSQLHSAGKNLPAPMRDRFFKRLAAAVPPVHFA